MADLWGYTIERDDPYAGWRGEARVARRAAKLPAEPQYAWRGCLVDPRREFTLPLRHRLGGSRLARLRPGDCVVVASYADFAGVVDMDECLSDWRRRRVRAVICGFPETVKAIGAAEVAAKLSRWDRVTRKTIDGIRRMYGHRREAVPGGHRFVEDPESRVEPSRLLEMHKNGMSLAQINEVVAGTRSPIGHRLYAPSPKAVDIIRAWIRRERDLRLRELRGRMVAQRQAAWRAALPALPCAASPRT